MFVGGESENQVAQIMSSLTHAIWLIAKLKIKVQIKIEKYL